MAFPSCGTLATDVPLPTVDAAHLKAWHTGVASPQTGTCAGSVPSAPGLAVGYVTVDAVNRCSTSNPSSAGYFAAGGTGVASNENVLMGDVFWVNAAEDFSQGDVAVHLRADAAAFGSGAYTFYGRLVGGTGVDARQPLGRKYGARYLQGGGFDAGTRLMVWRDPKSSSVSPLTCQTRVEPAAGERAGGAGRGGEGDARARRREPLPAGDAAGGGRSGDTGLRAVRAVGGGLLARRGGAVRGHRAGLAGGGELGRRTLLRRAPGTGAAGYLSGRGVR